MAPKPAARAPAFGHPWTSLDPPLTQWIADVIAQQGWERMTPVQAGTIPRAIKNQDCVVEAVTGSGKTLAFVIPVLERIVRNEHKFRKGEVAAIVIAPTRELAQQIHDVFHLFLATLIPPTPTPVDGEEPPPPPPAEYPLPMLVTSGTTTPYDTFFAQSSNILVGTPGRLASFLLGLRGMNAVRVGNLDVLVLDEADRLLSAPDHRRDVERIMRHLPKQRRTHLFSATMTDAVEEVVGLGLRNPVRIVVNLKDKRDGENKERRIPLGLNNKYMVTNPADKTLQLIRLLDREAAQNESAKMIVYFSTCAAVDYFYRVLSRLPQLERFHLVSLHGDLPPRVREASLSSFTSHASSHLSPSVLLCTDVAARGVDFPDIDCVVQYDAPTDPKTFSHRVGRTARAGRAGRATILLTRGREEEYIQFLSARKIPLARQPCLAAYPSEIDKPLPTNPPMDADTPALIAAIRDVLRTDRDLNDRGAKALVSSVRAYTKHEAAFIFRPTDLDYAALAAAFGLLRIPTMPEVRDWRKRGEKAAKKAADLAAKAKEDPSEENVAKAEAAAADVPIPVPWTDAEVDWDTYAYTDKAREAARKAAATEKAAKATDPEREKERAAERQKRKIRAELNGAWSVQKDRKVRKEERRDRKDARKQAEWERMRAEQGDEAAGAAPEPTARRAAKRKVEESSDDEEMDADYRSLKREVHEEKAAKKVNKSAKVAVGMFDDLD